MPKSPEENRQIRESQKQRILDAAKDAFLRKGCSVTMADIAAAAQISQGLAYRYFPSKKAIYLELMQKMTDRDIFGVKLAKRAAGTPAQRLHGLISELLKRLENVEILFQTALGTDRVERPLLLLHGTIQTMRNGSEQEKQMVGVMEQQYNALREMIVTLIEEGQRTGDFIQDDPRRLMVVLLTSIKGLASLAIHMPKEFETYAPYTDILFRMLKAE